MPELIPVEYMDEPGDLDPLPQDPNFWTSEVDWDWDEGLGMDWENEEDLGLADDEASEDEDERDGAPEVRIRPTVPPPTRIGRHVRRTLESMYSCRYETARNTLPRAPGFLPHVLHAYKSTRPDKFREQLRVNPSTFDRLVARLEADPVFANNSDNAQMPVEEQVAIALYRFGHYGNAASLQEVANWAGCGKGTVDLVTRRVMTAILRPDFLDEYVRHPTPAEKEKAKDWVESHSCRAWRKGWCMVDGTLVPFDERPFWYGESYYDRKCNYSLNIQVCSVSYPSPYTRSHSLSTCRSFPSPICASSRSVSVTPVARTTPQRGKKRTSQRTMTRSLRRMSSYGLIRLTRCVLCTIWLCIVVFKRSSVDPGLARCSVQDARA